MTQRVPDSQCPAKTSGSFNNAPTNNAKTITKCAIAIIIIFSIVAVTSFVIGVALPLTGFFLEFLSLKLAIIIAFIALSSSLLSVAICIGTKILDSLRIKKNKDGYLPFKNPIPRETPQGSRKKTLTSFEQALEELWPKIIKQFTSKHTLPNIMIGNIEINKISKASDIEKAMKNKVLQNSFKKMRYLKLQIKPEHFVTDLLPLFPNLKTLHFENFSKISSSAQKTFKQTVIELEKNAFKMLKNLKTLVIESFKIKIEKNFLPASIEEIYFKNNYIEFLSNDVFNNLPKLKVVDLSESTFRKYNTSTKKFDEIILSKTNFKVLSSTKITLPSPPPQKTSTLPTPSSRNSKPVKSHTFPKNPQIFSLQRQNQDTPTEYNIAIPPPPNTNTSDSSSNNTSTPSFNFDALQKRFEELKNNDKK